MTATIKQTEAIPATYPDAIGSPPLISPEALALDPAVIWQRIEAWVSWRWSERDVVWIVEGAGRWEPPLSPATITKCEIWRGGAWEELTLPAAPLGGFFLSGHGPYRFTGTVGDDEVAAPAAVLEAWRRLAEYCAQREFDAIAAGVSSFGSTAGAVGINFRRDPAYMARALENSGAADLLRPWRKPH